jgi:hypothetical protein
VVARGLVFEAKPWVESDEELQLDAKNLPPWITNAAFSPSGRIALFLCAA